MFHLKDSENWRLFEISALHEIENLMTYAFVSIWMIIMGEISRISW